MSRVQRETSTSAISACFDHDVNVGMAWCLRRFSFDDVTLHCTVTLIPRKNWKAYVLGE